MQQKVKTTCKIFLPKKIKPEVKHSRIYQFKGTEKHVKWYHRSAISKIQNEGNSIGQVVYSFFD